MTFNILRSAGVVEMISDCNAAGISAEWLVFGSVARGKPLPEDIDLLCLVESYDHRAKIVFVCEAFLLSAPIHLRILSRQDEARLRFIERSDARPVERAL